MSIVFCVNTLLLDFSQSSHTSLYAPVAQNLAPRLDTKYLLTRCGGVALC